LQAAVDCFRRIPSSPLGKRLEAWQLRLDVPLSAMAAASGHEAVMKRESPEARTSAGKGVVRPLATDFSAAQVCLLESEHGPGFSMPPTRHDFHKVLHVTAGEGMLCWRCGAKDREEPMRPGDFLYVGAQTEHWIRDAPGSPLTLTIVAVQPEVLAGYSPPQEIRVLREGAMVRDLRQALREMLVEAGLVRPERGLLLHGLAAWLLVRVCREGKVPDGMGMDGPRGSVERRVEAYLQSLEHGFFDDEPLDEVARRLGLSRRAFTSRFRSVAGMSREASLRQLRVAHACRLLRDTERSIIGIAFECGYNDLSSFYRAFKRETRRTPASWRKAALDRGDSTPY
jgi:AraC family L-rhamnose operon regulatory protein RhaS